MAEPQSIRSRYVPLVVSASLLSRLVLLSLALFPLIFVPGEGAVALVACLVLYFALGTLSGGAFSSWMRDLIPEESMGAYFGKRLAIATAIGAVLSLVAAFGI